MTIELLQTIIPPPKQPLYNSADWDTVEAMYGLTVPKDFKELLHVYGTGGFDDFLWILNPSSPNTNVNFEKSRYFLESYKAMKVDFPLDYPRPPFPEEESFFPWAVTDNGETLVWVISGIPNEWKVAIHSVDQGEEELYDMNAVTFLCSLMDRKLKPSLLPNQFPSQNPTFTPIG